jgi:hypothetical protein
MREKRSAECRLNLPSCKGEYLGLDPVSRDNFYTLFNDLGRVSFRSRTPREQHHFFAMNN